MNTLTQNWTKEMFDNQGFKHHLIEREAAIAKLSQAEQDEINKSGYRRSDQVTGFMSKEEAQKQLDSDTPHLLIKDNGLCLIGDRKVFFLSDDGGWGHTVLPKEFVAVSQRLPAFATPRPGLENGCIDTVDKFMLVYCRNEKLLNTIEELVDYLNENY